MNPNLLKLHKVFIKLQAFDPKQLIITITRIALFFKKRSYILSGPIALPTKKRIYCVLRSPHVNKDSREHFEIRTYTKILKVFASSFLNIKFFIPSGLKLKLFEYRE